MSVRRLVVGPFNRVEGDLEVTLEVAEGRVAAAYVNSPLYRGFEQILQGKAPDDALTLVPRICGICSVAQSSAAALALADAAGVEPPPNGRLAANLTLAAENLADHLTHFYLFFMPDVARDEYAGRAWHGRLAPRFRAGGEAAAAFLAARAPFMEVMGLLAGKWPHTLAVQPGGSTRPLTGSDLMRLQRMLREFRRFLEAAVFAAPLDEVAALDGVAGLGACGGDLGRFVDIAADLGLWDIGRAADRFLCVGAYREEGGNLFPPGVWHHGPAAFDAAQIREDTSHGWYVPTGEALPPAEGGALPMAGREGAYTWCKAPRLAGEPAETGALARQLVAGHPLARDMVARHGGCVAARVVARLLEVARLLPAMENWLRQVVPGEAFCVETRLADDCSGTGLVEAARGALGHWLVVRRGRIHNYQIVAPTTWNFSPRDAAGVPGPLEQALVGLPVGDDGRIPGGVHHVVRSFDPCMVCTVH